MKGWIVYALVAVVLAAVGFLLGSYQTDVYRKLLLWITLALGYNFLFGIAGQVTFSHFAFYGLGMEYRKEGRIDDAVATFAKLREKDPDYLPLYLMAGQTLIDAGRGAEAKSDRVSACEDGHCCLPVLVGTSARTAVANASTSTRGSPSLVSRSPTCSEAGEIVAIGRSADLGLPWTTPI